MNSRTKAASSMHPIINPDCFSNISTNKLALNNESGVPASNHIDPLLRILKVIFLSFRYILRISIISNSFLFDGLIFFK